MRRAAKVDSTQKEIVKTLRALGYSILDLSRVGQGCPDLLCARNEGWSFMVEVKRDAKAKFTPAQIKFKDKWRGRIYRVNSAEEAIKLFA